ncbi:MAG: hypothetical protein V9G18_15240 [Albidovulum sp.]
MNRLRERTTRIKMTDQGCMLRAYSRDIVDAINRCSEVNTFIPALAYSFAQNPTEVEVGHEERAAGESKYSLYSLIRLNFDLMTGFSVVPLQLFSLFGMLVAFVSARSWSSSPRRLIIGPEEGGPVHAVRDRLLPDRHRAVRHRPARRVRRPHLPGGAPAAPLPRDLGGPRTRARRVMSQRGRLRLPRRRRALPRDAARARRRRRAGGHARDKPGENIWFDSVRRASAADYGIPVDRARRPEHRRPWSRASRTLAPDFLFSFYYRLMLSPRRCSPCRRAARSTCTARCCRSTAAACR